MNVESFEILTKRTCGQMSNRPRIIIRLIQITRCISATHGKFISMFGWTNTYSKLCSYFSHSRQFAVAFERDLFHAIIFDA